MDFTLDNIVAGFLVRLTESIMIVVVIVILRVEFAALVFGHVELKAVVLAVAGFLEAEWRTS